MSRIPILRLVRQRSAPNLRDENDWNDYDSMWSGRLRYRAYDTKYIMDTFIKPVFFDYRDVWSAKNRAEIRKARSGFRLLARLVRIRQEMQTIKLLLKVSKNNELAHCAAYILMLESNKRMCKP